MHSRPLKGTKMRLVTLVALCTLASSVSGQVAYHFEGGAGNIGATTTQSFTLEVPTYVDSDATFSASVLSLCAVEILACTSVGFRQTDPNNALLGVIDFRTENTTSHYYFIRQAFKHPGQYRMVYSDYFNPATLWVSGPAVPEPGSGRLVMVGLGWIAWRKFGRR